MPETTLTPFIVLGPARSGTTLLKNLLRSHPNVLSFSELYCPGRIYWDYPGMESLSTEQVVAVRDADPVAFARLVFEGEYEQRFSCVGFKLLYSQLFSDALKPLLLHLGTMERLRVIHIHRRNLYKAYVSARIAQMRKEQGRSLNASDEADVDEDLSLHVDPKQCQSYFERLSHERSMAENVFIHQKIYRLTYEELTADMEDTMQGVLNFLDVAPAPLESDTVKVRKKPVREVVENHREVARHFRDTEWARFFGEDE